MAKNNGHQNFTYSVGIPTPPPYLGIVPKKRQVFWCFPNHLHIKNTILGQLLS